MGEPDLESNRRKNLILQRISDYFYVSDNLLKWSIIVLMKEAPHKSTMCTLLCSIHTGFVETHEILQFFDENGSRFLPTRNFHSVKPTRSIFLDLSVDPSAFHPHTTKQLKANN